jgi:hypothetical protein
MHLKKFTCDFDKPLAAGFTILNMIRKAKLIQIQYKIKGLGLKSFNRLIKWVELELTYIIYIHTSTQLELDMQYKPNTKN